MNKKTGTFSIGRSRYTLTSWLVPQSLAICHIVMKLNCLIMNNVSSCRKIFKPDEWTTVPPHDLHATVDEQNTASLCKPQWIGVLVHNLSSLIAIDYGRDTSSLPDYGLHDVLHHQLTLSKPTRTNADPNIQPPLKKKTWFCCSGSRGTKQAFPRRGFTHRKIRKSPWAKPGKGQPTN